MASESSHFFQQKTKPWSNMKYLVSLAKANYSKEIQKVILNPSYIDHIDFERYHKEAKSSTMKIICEATVLTEEQKQQVQKTLEDSLRRFEGINLKKRGSKSPAIGIHLGVCVSSSRLAIYDGHSHKIFCVNHDSSETDDSSFSPQSFLQQNVLVMKHLKDQAEKFIGQQIFNIVIAVPVDFSISQRRIVEKACHEIGLNVLQIISEPIAAGVAYNLHTIPTTAKVNYCLVFNFDDSEFHVSILTICDNQIHVASFKKDANLKNEINKNIMDYCIQEFKRQHEVDLMEMMASGDNEKAFIIANRMSRLESECQKLKELMMTMPKTNINSDVGKQREDLNRININVFQKCIQIVEQVLKDANIDRNLVDNIVLVGSSSRIQKVQEMLSDYFEGKPLLSSIDLKETIAIGATMLAFQTKDVEIWNVFFYGKATH